ncbi:FmdE family protein [Desulfotomaculum copahuensis]|uniref:Formylmethanofuran dehydrogenase n=1 Tax=Desulfotomaculum copahuensis TaxID=1838280 RepID=A0A1B7LE28_9FIRM|nr:FmdE family protein [Desulfotomaculum copahuensis]OAT81362.1 hypothetical protein A6M21_10805 [Desulfotomaculum copahuensis]
MCLGKSDWEKAFEFHGHICPGLAIGFRATQLALHELGAGRSIDEEMVALVENKACGVDALQVLTGCTFGKGNLFFHDYGKHVYTIAHRSENRGVRIAVKYGAFDRPELARLRQLAASGQAGPEEKRQLAKLQQEFIENILNAGRDCFDISRVDLDLPPKAQIHQSIRCASCGEAVMETRTRNINGKLLCIPCAEKLT